MKKFTLIEVEKYALSMSEGMSENFDMACCRDALVAEIDGIWGADYYANRMFRDTVKIEVHVKELDNCMETASDEETIAAVRRAGVIGEYTGEWHCNASDETLIMYVVASSNVSPEVVLAEKMADAQHLYAEAYAFYQTIRSFVAAGKLKLAD